MCEKKIFFSMVISSFEIRITSNVIEGFYDNIDDLCIIFCVIKY